MNSEDDSLPFHPKIPRGIEVLLDKSHEYLKSDPDAALRIVTKISKKYQSYPQVLEQKWLALHTLSSHQEAYEVASFLCLEYPRNFWGWLYKAESLAYLKRFDEAVEVLAKESEKSFLPNANLKIAAYRYAQGRREEALVMLRHIIANDTHGHARSYAKSEPLLAEVREIL